MLRHHPGETRVFRFAGRELLRYGYASPWRYYMQARALTWLIWKYKSPGDVLRYATKWGKALLFFDHKGTYIKEMLKGSREGISLWAKDKAGD